MNPREDFKGPNSGPPLPLEPHRDHPCDLHSSGETQRSTLAHREPPQGAYRWPAAPGWRQCGNCFEKLKAKDKKKHRHYMHDPTEKTFTR